MEGVIVVDHPLVQHKLTLLREKELSTKSFRELAREIGILLCYEVTRDLPLEWAEIETPMTRMKAPKIGGKKLVFAPILRAGLALVEGMLDLVPAARVAHIGLYRDPETLTAVEYYLKTPADLAARRPRLLEGTMNRDAMRAGQAAERAAGREPDFDADQPMEDGEPIGTPEAEISWRVDVSADIEAKRAALAAHHSQTTGGSGVRTVEVVLQHRPVVGVRAPVDHDLRPSARREAAKVREPLLGDEDVDIVLGVVDVGDHRDDARQLSALGGGGRDEGGDVGVAGEVA